MYRALFGFLVALVLVTSARAHGQPLRRPALHWTRSAAASECIDPRSLAERVEELTGRPFVYPAEADYSIEGHVERASQGGFRARFSLTRRRGKPVGVRELVHAGANCRAFDAGLTFVLALMVDPNLDLDRLSAVLGPTPEAPEAHLLEELQRAPEVAPPETASKSAAPHSEAAAPVEPRSVVVAPAPRITLGGAVFVASALSPELEIGAALAVSYRLRGAWGLVSWTRGAFSPAVDLPLSGSRRASSVGSALLVEWGRSIVGSWSLGVALGPDVGAQHASANDLPGAGGAWLASYGLLSRLRLSRDVGRGVVVSAHGLAGWNGARKRFTYEYEGGTHSAYALRRFWGGGAFGVSRRF